MSETTCAYCSEPGEYDPVCDEVVCPSCYGVMLDAVDSGDW